jgi:hypothetical protein
MNHEWLMKEVQAPDVCSGPKFLSKNKDYIAI